MFLTDFFNQFCCRLTGVHHIGFTIAWVFESDRYIQRIRCLSQFLNILHELAVVLERGGVGHDIFSAEFIGEGHAVFKYLNDPVPGQVDMG